MDSHSQDDQGSVVHLIGKGYNLVTGESMVEDVFEYETVRNDFGMLVPATAKTTANKSAQSNEMNSETRFSYRFEQRVCDVSLGNLKELLAQGGPGVVNTSTKWCGGDIQFHSADQMLEWRESLSKRPQLLVGEDNMKTTWISVLVGMVDPEKEEAMGLALKMFLEREARIKDAASRQFETVHQMLEEVRRTLVRTTEVTSCIKCTHKYRYERDPHAYGCQKTSDRKCVIL